MIKFSSPGSLYFSLYETYLYLGEQLVLLLGHPIKFRRPITGENGDIPARRLSDGSIEYVLPGPRDSDKHYYVTLPPEASKDKYCTKLLSIFVSLCKRISKDAKNSWDLKAAIIREDKFIWDHFVLSLTHVGGQKYNALELLTSMRESLLFRYEGQQLEVGVIATWNWFTLKPRLESLGCTLLQLKERMDLRDTFRKSKMMHALSDGENTFLITTPNGWILDWVSFPTEKLVKKIPDWEVVPSRYHHLKTIT